MSLPSDEKRTFCVVFAFLFHGNCSGSFHFSSTRLSGGATVLGKLPVPGVLLIWIRVGQWPTALAEGAGGGCLEIFSLSSIISVFFLPLSGRRPDID